MFSSTLLPQSLHRSRYCISRWAPHAAAIIYLFSSLAGLKSSAAEAQIFVLYAGSLGNFMEKDLGPAFSRATGYKYLGEAEGSVLGANMIKGKLRAPDVFISADPNVNHVLMGAENGNLVRWYFTIFGNSLALGYSSQSRFAPELAQVHMGDFHLYEILQNKEFRLGRGDPELDPKGYRTLFLFDLAEKYYKQPGLAVNLLHAPDHPTVVYPEVQLVARLEAGQLDACIFYRNEVAEHNLPYIAFPRELDLSDPELDSSYSVAKYVSPKGATFSGSAIVYSITIPENSRNRDGAIALVRYLLSDEGRKIMEKHALRIIQPVVSGEIAAVPPTLQNLLKNVTSR
jgi:molybdate/tungstate transport system substrate-binding protein